jgi:hypothetical protein
MHNTVNCGTSAGTDLGMEPRGLGCSTALRHVTVASTEVVSYTDQSGECYMIRYTRNPLVQMVKKEMSVAKGGEVMQFQE